MAPPLVWTGWTPGCPSKQRRSVLSRFTSRLASLTRRARLPTLVLVSHGAWRSPWPWVLVVGLVLSGCSTDHPTQRPQPVAQPLAQSDLRWLNRVTFGLDSAMVARYRALGRAGFLDEQLQAPPPDPPDLATAIGTLTITQQSAERLLRELRPEHQRINTPPAPTDNHRPRTPLN